MRRALPYRACRPFVNNEDGVENVIVNLTRSFVRVSLKGRTATLIGEAFLRGHGSPDFVAYTSSLRSWEDGGELSEEDRRRIFEDLLLSAQERGLTIALE